MHGTCFCAKYVDKLVALSRLLVGVLLTKHDWHLIWVKQDLFVEWALHKLQDKHLLGGSVHVQINVGAPFHEFYQIHEPVDFLRYQPQLLEVLPVHSLNDVVKALDLLQLEDLDTAMEVVGLQPVGHFREKLGGMLFNHELVLTGFVHPESVFLVKVDSRNARTCEIIDPFLALAG